MVVMIFAPHDGSITTIGTDRGREFVAKRQDIVSQFVAHVSG